MLFRNKYRYIVLIVLTLCSCRSSDQSRTVLSFWAMGAEGENIQSLLPAFYALHPDIQVRVQAIPWSAAHDLLLTAFAGGSYPDVCQLGNTWIPEFQAIGAIMALDSCLQSSTVSRESFFPGIWETNVIHGHVYGIPWYVDTRLLFYRTDLFERVGYAHAPKDWDDWLQVSRRLTQSGQSPYALFLSTRFNDWQVPVILIMQNEGRLLRDDDCYGAFDDPATLKALEFYIQFFREKLAIMNMSEVANVYQGFSDGVFAMMITGPWNVNEMSKRSPDLQDRWTTAPLPARLNGASTAGGASLVIFSQSPHHRQAWIFIEYLTRVETQRHFFELTRDLPAVREAWNVDEIQQDDEIMAFYRQLEGAMPTPKIAEWEQVAVKLQEYLELVIFERMTLKEAMKALNRDVDRILEKRRWMIQRGLLY
ncbi:sugar ABC transporter substrate-binding protein [candidate division KSB1 bacterium]|nr:sugar ABC transporter substrate-binding protein [candidate division KSB1 bacterium]